MKWRIFKSQTGLWDLIFDMNGLGVKLGYISHGLTDVGDNYWLYLGDQAIYRAASLDGVCTYFAELLKRMATAEVVYGNAN